MCGVSPIQFFGGFLEFVLLCKAHKDSQFELLVAPYHCGYQVYVQGITRLFTSMIRHHDESFYAERCLLIVDCTAKYFFLL